MSRKNLLTFVALGLVGGAASVATAQPYMVNGTGATLFQFVFKRPASTNDFIDVNGDCRLAIDGDQLAPFDGSFPWRPDQHWQVTYRVVGSVNGFIELRDWGFTYLTMPDLDSGAGTYISSFSDESLWNRDVFVSAGIPQGFYNAANPGGTPVRSLMDGSFLVTTSTDPAVGGILVDFAAIDVPIGWSVQQGGQPKFNRVPGAVGYGSNPAPIVNKDGSEVVTEDSRLPSLFGLNGPINVNYANPDEYTAYDTLIANAPVGIMVNYGVGMHEIYMSDLRHLYATGRRDNGENLMAVTRDVGSGTRNAKANGICLDPSWCVGENIGARTVDSARDRLGPNFQPSNKGGSSRVESTVINHRLALGHTGAERGASAGWLTGGRADFLAVISDLKGGTVAARPNLVNVLDAGPNGYNIQGPGVLATIGDPMSAPAHLGGYGMLEPFLDWGLDGISGTGDTGEGNCQYDLGEPFVDMNGNGIRDAVEPRPAEHTLNPAMRNEQAAAYVNNIMRSIQAFSEVPSADENLFTPGEYMALNYVLVAASLNVPQNPPPLDADCVPLIPNPDFNPALYDFVLNQSGNVLGTPPFNNFNFSASGVAPTRTTGITYSDGVAGGGNYVDQAGNPVSYGSSLNARNKIAGDFNNDGKRDLNDALEMMKAYHARNGGPAWQAGTPAVIEILGDFNGDGNFDAADIRYWADGLAIDPATGRLNRAKGFKAVDDAWQTLTGNNNFFGTTIDGGGMYMSGDSAADVAGPGSLHTPGFAPIGHDGVIDMHDVDYIKAQFIGNPFVLDGVANWDDINEAVGFDLSADVTGDLRVNQDDVNAVLAILGLNCPADFNGDTVVNTLDFVAFLNAFVAGHSSADFNGDTVVNTLDFVAFLNAFVAGCP
ncbi:MAG: hypothetical protein KIS87_14860 [Phycisphaeraceae bacterium]|nr:hypothetical protein [Phycisphaeraceae bacterium]